MELQRLASSAITEAGYDPETQELRLRFRSGHLYCYVGVPAALFDWLLRVKNKGGFVRRMLSGRYGEHALAETPAGTPELELEQALLASLERLGKP